MVLFHHLKISIPKWLTEGCDHCQLQHCQLIIQYALSYIFNGYANYSLMACVYIKQHFLFAPQDVLNGKPSKWFPLKPRVPVYMDSEQQCAILFQHLKALLDNSKTQLNFTDEVEFICSFLFPEVGPNMSVNWIVSFIAIYAMFYILINLFIYMDRPSFMAYVRCRHYPGRRLRRFSSVALLITLGMLVICICKKIYYLLLHNIFDNGIHLLF